MYDIFTVLNQDYYTFGELFVKSLERQANNELRTVHIVDTGLEEKSKNYLSQFADINWILPEEKYKGPSNDHYHSQQWHWNIDSKTENLLKLVSSSDVPVMMVDSDCAFVRNPSELISDFNADIEVCEREHPVRFLASFFVAHPTPSATNFIEHWIRLMRTVGYIKVTELGLPSAVDTGFYKQRESPCLTSLVDGGDYIDNINHKLIRDKLYTDEFVKEFGNRDSLIDNLNIVVHKDNVVSASTSDFSNDECAIIHFKSRTSRDTIEDRLDGLTLEGILK